MKHLADGPDVVFGPPRPEDPFEMVDIVIQALPEF